MRERIGTLDGIARSQATDPWPHHFLRSFDERLASRNREQAQVGSERREARRIKVLHREQKQGLGKAYLHAFRWALDAKYQYIIEMDADFSHDPRYLPTMLDEAMAGNDLVLGSRYVDGGGTVNWGPARRAISRGGSLYARSILGVRIQDLTGGFKCFRRAVLEALDLNAVKSTGYAFQIELTYRALKGGFKIKEVPIVFEDRRVGQSKMSRKIFLEALTMVWKLKLSV